MKYFLWVLGWIWMLPNTILSLPILAGGWVKFHRFHRDRYWALHFIAKKGGLAALFLEKGHFGGYTNGPFIVSANEATADNPRHIAHECRHVWQQMVFGVFQWIIYGINYVVNRARGMPHRDAYMALLFEVDARKAEG